ncbi:hypothetical protein F4808DRAFT_462873 [Astrocystis sublimbata]|nr:hypothetical protein F4808DRAFT_462873 [Astrocystis sublimbata]
MPPDQFPQFNDLPLAKRWATWECLGVWGQWGGQDELGTLNHLTDEVVAKAAAENIKSGLRVSLNWSMQGAAKPRFPRKVVEVKLINKAPLKHAHDDELYYMGRTADDFAASPEPNGIQHIAAKGIAGRAVFIDWYRWAQAQAIEVDATTAYAVPFEELLEVMRYQNMGLNDLRKGDILVIRFGYLAQYEGMSEAKRDELDNRYKTHKPENIGVKPSRELLEMLWDKKIAAICGDSRSLEVWPCTELEWHLHEWLLAGWGMPIGELFYLEELSKICEQRKRYTFFMSSSPMNVPGGVASPPNALAFF